MILYPWEQWKTYLGFSRTGEYENIDSTGSAGMEFGPTSRNTTTVAMGHSINHRMFATLTAPYIVNHREGRERSSWGDPSVAARYTAVQPDIAEEWIPQVQILGGYRQATSTSVYDYSDPDQLDVVSTGFSDARTGIDVWQGMFPWKAGFAQTFSAPAGERDVEGERILPGYVFRTTVTGGYGWGDSGKIIVGINREQTTRKQVDGALVDGSDKISHGVFAAADANMGRTSSVRVSWVHNASIFENRNATRNQVYAVAFTRSF